VLRRLRSRLRNSVSQRYEPVLAVVVLERGMALRGAVALVVVPWVLGEGVVRLVEGEARAPRVLGT